jgi:hypothetical protein
MIAITAIVTAIPIPIPPPVETPSFARGVDMAVEEVNINGADAVGVGEPRTGTTTDTKAASVLSKAVGLRVVVAVAILSDVEVPFITVTDSRGDGPPGTILNCPDSTTNAVLFGKVQSKRIL